jgi:acyl dehydratase
VDATAANDIDAYTGDDAIAPPMFGVAFSFGALGAPILDGDLNVDMLRLVHGEQDMAFLRAVRPGSKIRSVSRISDIQEKSSGELLLVGIESFDEAGDKVLEATSSLFIRGPRRKTKDAVKAERGARDDASAAFDDAPELFSATQEVAADQSARYAEASGDHNPIHTDEDAAKMAGLPGIILHGLCSMAFAHNALVRHAGGDPLAVQRLKVRFSKPVLMGDSLTVEARGPAAGPVLLVVKNQHGDLVLSEGVAELRG